MTGAEQLTAEKKNCQTFRSHSIQCCVKCKAVKSFQGKRGGSVTAKRAGNKLGLLGHVWCNVKAAKSAASVPYGDVEVL